MTKKVNKQATTETSSTGADKRKDEAIRKRFMIEKPKNAPTNHLLMSPAGSAGSGRTASTTDASMSNPLAESLTAEQLLRQ